MRIFVSQEYAPPASQLVENVEEGLCHQYHQMLKRGGFDAVHLSACWLLPLMLWSVEISGGLVLMAFEDGLCSESLMRGALISSKCLGSFLWENFHRILWLRRMTPFPTKMYKGLITFTSLNNDPICWVYHRQGSGSG